MKAKDAGPPEANAGSAGEMPGRRRPKLVTTTRQWSSGRDSSRLVYVGTSGIHGEGAAAGGTSRDRRGNRSGWRPAGCGSCGLPRHAEQVMHG